MSTPAVQHNDCQLLSLAAELRNRIYRYVILEEDPTRLTAVGHNRAGLLNTCKQIRKEALKIYYCENVFDFDVPDYDATALAKFMTKLQAVGLSTDSSLPELKRVSVPFAADGSPSWTNLRN